MYIGISITQDDIGTSSAETVFHFLKKPVWNQYPRVLRILVLPEVLVPAEIWAQLERHCLCSTEYFPDPIHKKDFGIYQPVTNCNFPKGLAQTKYVCVGS